MINQNRMVTRGKNERSSCSLALEQVKPCQPTHRQAKQIGFVKDARRINVAITRAQKTLIILGNANALQRDSTWKRIIQHTKCTGTYYEVRKKYPKLTK